VSAWASEARLVLAQRAVHAKASELGALPAVLQLLALEGPSTVPRPTPLVDTRAVLNDRIAHLVGAGVVEIVRLVTVVVPDTAFRDGPDARSGDVANSCGEL
jgi:hypothetical protein